MSTLLGNAKTCGWWSAFRLVETAAAGEDHVGDAEQLGFVGLQLLRRAGERRQLIHTVVDDGHGAEMVGKREAHRRVVPEGELLANMGADGRIEQFPLNVQLPPQVRRQVGDSHQDAARTRRHLHVRVTLHPHRLFDVEHATLPGRTIEQVLGPLQDEVPP